MIEFTITPRLTNDGFNLESETLGHGKLWYGNVDSAIGYAQHRAGSKPATIRVFGTAGAVIQTIMHDPNAREGAGTLGVI